MKHCPIKGFQGTSLIDYPGRIASIIFIGGCNFRCRYCYNWPLLSASDLPDNDPDAVLRELAKREDFIEGVVVTGGEPTIHPGIIQLLKAIKNLGIDVKLDTNGTHPEILEWVIADKLAEYIAMDYKAPLDKLESVARIRGAEHKVHASAEILIKRAKRYEFRTTVHPQILTLDDIDSIADEIRGAAAYYIQQFHRVDCLDPDLISDPQYSAEFFRRAAARVGDRFPTFAIRNLTEHVPAHIPAAGAHVDGAAAESPDLVSVDRH